MTNASRLIALAVPALVLVATAGSADANFSAHEKVTVTEMKSKGEVIGLRIKMTLRPDSSGYKIVRAGIGPQGGNHDSSDGWRKKASDPAEGHLLHQFPEITDIQNNTPKEVTLEVKYADAPNLQPGQDVEIITAWHGHPSHPTHWHIYGMSSPMSGPVKSFKLPGKKQSQAQQVARRTQTAAKAKRSATPRTLLVHSKAKGKANQSSSKTRAIKRASKSTVLEASRGLSAAKPGVRGLQAKSARVGKATSAKRASAKRVSAKRAKVKAR